MSGNHRSENRHPRVRHSTTGYAVASQTDLRHQIFVKSLGEVKIWPDRFFILSTGGHV